MRAALTHNPTLSETLQLQLAYSDDVYVRAELAASPFITSSVTEKLSGDIDWVVHDALFQNPATPGYIREELGRQLDEEDDESVDSNNGYRNQGDDYEKDSEDDHGFYRDRGVEHDGKYYEVVGLSDYGGHGTMYYDEDNGWLSELP